MARIQILIEVNFRIRSGSIKMFLDPHYGVQM